MQMTLEQLGSDSLLHFHGENNNACEFKIGLGNTLTYEGVNRGVAAKPLVTECMFADGA